MTRLTSLFFVSLLSAATFTAAQLSSLPECAVPCADKAATANNCKNTDLSCVCSKQSFIDATLECIQAACPVEDRSSAQGLLGEICASAPPPPAGSPAVSVSVPPVTSSSTPASASASKSASVGTPTTTTAPVAAPVTTSVTVRPVTTQVTLPGGSVVTTVPDIAASRTSTGSESASSTLVVVETIVDTPNLNGAMSAVQLGGAGVGGIVTLALTMGAAMVGFF